MIGGLPRVCLVGRRSSGSRLANRRLLLAARPQACRRKTTKRHTDTRKTMLARGPPPPPPPPPPPHPPPPPPPPAPPPGAPRPGNGPLSLRDLPSVQDGRKILPDPGARARNLAIGTTEPPGRAAKPNGGFFFFMGSAILRQAWAPGCSFVTAATSVEHHSQSGERLAMRETQETGMWRCGATRLAYCLSSVASGQSG
jgi:hypothetical protein